jgi:hypothetical protein
MFPLPMFYTVTRPTQSLWHTKHLSCHQKEVLFTPASPNTKHNHSRSHNTTDYNFVKIYYLFIAPYSFQLTIHLFIYSIIYSTMLIIVISRISKSSISEPIIFIDDTNVIICNKNLYHFSKIGNLILYQEMVYC